MDLKQLRGQIDGIDEQLVRLFLQRMEIASDIADCKKESNLPIWIPAREEEKLLALSEQVPPHMGDYVRQLYTQLFRLSRDYQQLRSRQVRCGLLGRKLSHSYSPQIHRFFGDYPYTLFEKEPEELEAFLRHGDFTGLNVTIPYKKAVLPNLDDLTPTAKRLGAVNTILRRPDGSLLGHNTDLHGFRYLLRKSGLEVRGKKVLVLGSGGASGTAVAALEESGAEVTVISRTGENNYENLSRHYDARVIVNTTPVGMYPGNGASPVDLTLFPNCEGVLDLVYNPIRTALLLQAERLNIPHAGGLYMLVEQARRAGELFTGTQIDKAVTARIERILSRTMENVVLVGMPGSGKGTIAALLAEKCGRKALDSDILVEEKAGMTIPQMFERYGEAYFRDRETEALTELGRSSGIVLATGGGSVLREENYDPLHQNGVIVFLERDISLLPTNNRPLSQGNSLEKLYNSRIDSYRRFADITVESTGIIEKTAELIISAFLEFVNQEVSDK